jgi:hypothetical protein
VGEAGTHGHATRVDGDQSLCRHFGKEQGEPKVYGVCLGQCQGSEKCPLECIDSIWSEDQRRLGPRSGIFENFRYNPIIFFLFVTTPVVVEVREAGISSLSQIPEYWKLACAA